MFGKSKNKVDKAGNIEGINVAEFDKKIEEDTERLVELLNKDDGKVPIRVLVSVTTFFFACCTLILTPYIIRQFDNLCYESIFHGASTISFAYGRAGTDRTYPEAKLYCEECSGFSEARDGGGCSALGAGVTGRLVNMNSTEDVNAVNELVVEILRPLYDEKFWVEELSNDTTTVYQSIQIPDHLDFNYKVETNIESDPIAKMEVICVYEGMTCEKEKDQRGPQRFLVI